ncbi:MAG: hypothetical protein WBJ21_14200 [Burkholderiaceae bacterium]
MKSTLAILLFCIASLPALAQTRLLVGQPQIVSEFEQERAADHSGRSNSITLYPGIRWQEGWINQAEFMLTREREAESDGTHTYANDFGFRLRKNVHFTEDFGGFVRGLIGRKSQSDSAYSYAYMEAALTYDTEPVQWYAGFRFIRAIDGSSGHDVNRLRLGPGWDINEHHEVEMRWARGWDAVTKAHLSDSVEIEYTYKF